VGRKVLVLEVFEHLKLPLVALDDLLIAKVDDSLEWK